MLLLILFVAIVTHVSCDTRIIGGQIASPGQFPYKVSIFLNNNHYCGGSIISEYFILTAAHCTIDQSPSQMQVLAGSVDLLSGIGLLFNIAEFIPHPQYNHQTRDFDMSLIKLTVKIPLGSSTMNKIEMVSADASYLAGTLAIVSGFGAIDANLNTIPNLKYAYVPLVDSISCDIFFPITDRMICAGEYHGQVGACQGDSGGPLTVQNKLLGVVSFGPGCGNTGPAVYSSVPALRSWIKKVTGV